MSDSNKAILVALLVLLIAALGGILLTRDWADSPRRLHADVTRGQHVQQLVDTSALETAQQLSALAVSHWEQQYAADALRLADHSVDLAFTAGLADAVENPPTITPETQEILNRIKDVQARVDAGTAAVKKLTDAAAKAPVGPAKTAAQDKVEIAQAQLALDQDELEDDHEDLVRAGGDKRALIQKQLDQHEAGETHATKPGEPAATGASSGGAGGSAANGSASNSTAGVGTTPVVVPADSPEYGNPSALLKQVQAVFSMTTKESLLLQAQQNALKRVATLQGEHDALEKQLAQEKTQKKIIRRKTKSSQFYAALAGHGANAGIGKTATVGGAAAGGANGAGAGAQSGGGAGKSERQQEIEAEEREAGTTEKSADDLSQVEYIQHLNADQKMLALYDKRIADEEALAKVYGDWNTLVVARHHAIVHGIFVNAMWIILIALFVFVSNVGLQKIFVKVQLERRQAATMRAIFLVVTQLIGAVLIIFVFFGPPNNLGTVAALAGAGITVAMKDFIVGFFGWFILMGKNGIHQGDWVEINGVGGEVLELGLLHTVLLETGSWADAGHPTGRKVTFVNSYAIEGHYFNFSTSGQWLWDELQITVPATKDPFATANQIQQMTAEATKGNAEAAKADWERASPGTGAASFSAEPSMSIKPSGGGVDVRVRYLTRANDRHETRAKLYHEVVDLLHGDAAPTTPAPTSPSKSS
jgi:small-conductance mechanosensitive channel